MTSFSRLSFASALSRASQEFQGARHTPTFFVDESSLLLGVRTLVHLTVDFLNDPEI